MDTNVVVADDNGETEITSTPLDPYNDNATNVGNGKFVSISRVLVPFTSVDN